MKSPQNRRHRSSRSAATFLLLAIAVGILLAGGYGVLRGTGSSSASTSCGLGGQPAPSSSGAHDESDNMGGTAPTVFGCRRIAGRGLIQLVVSEIPRALCVSINFPATSESRGAFCATRDTKWLACGQPSLCANGAGYVSQDGQIYTEFSGQLAGGVERVEVHYRYRGKSLTDDAIVGQIDGELLKALHLDQKVGAFAVILPGCVDITGIRVIAISPYGNQRTKVRAIPVSSCKSAMRNAQFGGESFTLHLR
jgi:hypothetical protein